MTEVDIASAAQSVNWTAIIGILGTLGGLAIGAFATYKIQERQLAYKDKTRFHDLRMEKYAEFTQAANKVVAFFATGLYDAEAAFAFQKSYNTVRLVSSEDVLVLAQEISQCFGLMQDDTIDKKAVNKVVFDRFNNAMGRFIAAARAELIK